MKLLYITSKFPPVAGGAGSIAFELGKRLSKRHYIQVLTEHFPGTKEVEVINENFVVQRIKVLPGLKSNFLSSFLFLTGKCGALAALKEDFDIVHFHDVTVAVGNFITSLFRGPTVFKYGGDFAYEYLSLRKPTGWDPGLGDRRAWNFNFESKLVFAIEKMYCKTFDFIYSNSDYGLKLLNHIGISKNKTKVVRNGINIEKFNPKKFNKGKIREELNLTGTIFLTTNRLVPWKGVDVLIKAFNKIGNKKCKLFVTGTGPEGSRLKQLAKGNVVFLGNLMPDDFMKYLCASDIFVLPSFFDWCPNSLLEAMAMSKLVIGTNVGGVPEIVEDGAGFLCKPKNVDDMLKKLKITLELTESERTLYGKNARKVIEKKFDVEKMTKEVEKVYKELV